MSTTTHADQTGRSITSAVNSLWMFFREVFQFIEESDAAMAEHGWVPTGEGWVTDELSPKLKADKWMAYWFFRFYVPANTVSVFTSLRAVVIRLDGTAVFDQPVVLAVTAEFPTSTDWATVNDGWKSSDRIIDALGAKPGPRSLNRNEYADFLRDASTVTGFVVPLCHLSGADDLRERVFAPLLAK